MIAQYDKGKHCTFHHRFHLVWITKYRYRVLQGDVRFRVREIIRQVCTGYGVGIISGVVASDHVHMFLSIPPKLSVADLIRKMKGRSSHKVQREFPQLKRCYWGRGYFSATNGAITEDTVLQYLEENGNKFTDASRYWSNLTSTSIGCSQNVYSILREPDRS